MMQHQAQLERRIGLTQSVKDVLIHTLNLELTPDQIDNDTLLFGSGIGLDSIDALQLVVGLETESGVTLPQSQFAVMRSVNTIVDFIMKLHEKPSLQDLTTTLNDGMGIDTNGYTALRHDLAICQRNDLTILRFKGDAVTDDLNELFTGKQAFYRNTA